uniref:Uncharacterized protein n=1 Tax=Arundo donax TaxID=35708 RepID=A0A0A8YFR6_ARUDO
MAISLKKTRWSKISESF